MFGRSGGSVHPPIATAQPAFGTAYAVSMDGGEYADQHRAKK
jgi:hypothetical protein